mmetsp:Transcript_100949/g.184131  ORF Transcript_100949/g.184131 Transcript_100949/m.184131 type:complete len:313 (+) Transcript_100949:68-1006(+)
MWGRAGPGRRLAGEPQRKWRRIGAAVLLVVLTAVLVTTNPGWSNESFRHFLRSRRSVPATQRLAEALGVVKLRVWNFGLLAIGWEGSNAFLGAVDQWVALPTGASFRQLGWPPSRDVDALCCTFVILFLLWRVNRQFMERHCIASRRNISAGRVWCLLAAQLSHISLEHLISNAVFLYSVAPTAHAALGRYQFLALYFLGGLCGIVASLALSPLLLHHGLTVECLGASGSLFAMLGFMACRADSGYGSGRVLWLGRTWRWPELALLQTLLSLGFGAVRDAARGIDIISHIAGFAAGWAIEKWLGFGASWIHI